MQVSVWDEEPIENNKNKRRLFWLIVGIVISVLAVAAFCVPLGVGLARNVDMATTTAPTTTRVITTVTTTAPTTTTVTTTALTTTTVVTTTSGK